MVDSRSVAETLNVARDRVTSRDVNYFMDGNLC